MAEDKGLRFNAGKTRHDLVPPFAQEQYAKVLTAGAAKYADHNWAQGMKWSKVLASMKRHILEFESGADNDIESGVLHMAHVMCNAAFLTEYYKIYPQGDDRQHNYLRSPRIGLDIDEVLCNFTGGWHKRWGTDPAPEWWNYHRGMGDHFEQMHADGSIEAFYLGLEPKIAPSDIPFEPACYVTSRPIDTDVTEEWLHKHGFPAVPVHTVPMGSSKVDVIKKANIDIFVDDCFSNFVELNKAGICCFLMDAPHNRRYNVGFKRLKELRNLTH